MLESIHRLACILALLVPATLMAQDHPQPAENPTPVVVPNEPACTSDEHRQFDFWLGDWEVTADGRFAGSNRVVLVNGDCALQENWQGAGPSAVSGSSYNIYDRATGSWHQTWVDSTGNLLQLDGGLVDGVMVLSGERPGPDGQGIARHRISWTPNDDGTVRQYWEMSLDGRNWSVLFDGMYRRSSR